MGHWEKRVTKISDKSGLVQKRDDTDRLSVGQMNYMEKMIDWFFGEIFHFNHYYYLFDLEINLNI